MSKFAVQIFIGNIIHCSKPFSIEVIEDGFIAVQGSKIIAIGNKSNLNDFKDKHTNISIKETVLNKWQILIPGFIDTHNHASQYANLGLGLDTTLNEWLNDYTCFLEKKFADIEFAKKSYNTVVKQTLFHGTTTAAYFATFHLESTLALADIAIQHGQRAFVGKTNRTTNLPDDSKESSQVAMDNTKRFIKAMADKKSNLVQPIITPNFALHLTLDDMKELASLAKENNLRIQTHMCENKFEHAEIQRIFKKTYDQLYIENGLLTDKTIIAHAVHLSDADVNLVVIQKSSVAHCPSSNFNLKSGICDVKRLIAAGVNVGLGSDISAGNNVGIVNEMRYAMVASTSLSFQKENYDPINYKDAFFLATLGGAKALSLDDVVGNFKIGKEFDALIIDLKVESASAEFYTESTTPLKTLQRFIYVGDDRNIASVFVAGRKVK